MKIEIDNDNDSTKLVYSAELILDKDSEDIITCITCYESNIYVGTSSGRVLHYHRFEDIPGYMLIANIQVHEDSINKFVIIPVVNKILILCGTIATFYNLPELSPTNTRKLKEINDISLLQYSSENNRSSDKLLLFTSSNVRIVQYEEEQEQVKLLKQINYANAVKGISTTSTMSTNFSNLVLVANNKNYDILDLRLTRKIPLFEYRTDIDTQIQPNIIQFRAEDKGPNNQEYLLTINSGDSTSLAMFINSLGDVTRGTLTWSDYPIGGLAIEWPYLFGIFPDNKLKISSLVSLETKQDIEIQGLEQETTQEFEMQFQFRIERTSKISIENSSLMEILRSRYFKDNTKSLLTETIDHSGSVIILSQSKVWLLCPENEILRIYEAWQYALTNDTDTDTDTQSFLDEALSIVDQYSGHIKSFLIHMILLYYLKDNKIQEATKFLYLTIDKKLVVDAHLIVYLYGFNYDDLDFPLPFGIEKNLSKLTMSKNDEFILLYLKRVYPLLNDSPAIRRTYWKLINSDDEVIEFVNGKDKLNWKTMDNENETIIRILQEKKLFKSLIFVYQYLLKTVPSEELAIRLCDLLLQLKDDIADHNELVSNILDNLPLISSETSYSSYLFEVLKINKDKGLSYMKSNNKSKFKSVHNEIMQEISSKYGDELDFSLLRIEFLESSLSGTSNSLHELFIEVKKLIVSPTIFTETNKNNFEILVQTYHIVNSLNDSKWPKIPWPDYLYIRLGTSGCDDFIGLYLKLLELVQITDEFSLDDEMLHDEIFSYFNVLNPLKDPITILLQHYDFSSAEAYAINGQLPSSKAAYYRDFVSKQQQSININVKDNLKTILNYYLDQTTTDTLNNFAVAHFISNYGSSYFTPNEIMEKLPGDVPLIHLVEYIENVIIQLKIGNKQNILQKSLIRADSELTKQIYRQFSTQETP
ncbi:uncharacterized protein RJT21DRAFT_48626 [Scheffersomyces amazonensis]|uniref:uncharacterized protein n=1 Tax=Scheffersomyces amazonensis TaxID=1078765 RepID=UPI00315DB52F